MPRISLNIYTSPGQADVICQLKLKGEDYQRLTATVDTGAAVSLFPRLLLDSLDTDPPEQRAITIDQAGIANQSFQAVETTVTIILEDAHGNVTQPFKIRAWFGDTNEPLIGFAGILDRAILHIDMLQQTGWLEI
jgi:hypothetical protein